MSGTKKSVYGATTVEELTVGATKVLRQWPSRPYRGRGLLNLKRSIMNATIEILYYIILYIHLNEYVTHRWCDPVSRQPIWL